MVKFWVVIRPKHFHNKYYLTDIYFESTPTGMMLQAMGGLKPEEVISVHDNEQDAIKQAEQVMSLHNQMVNLAKEMK